MPRCSPVRNSPYPSTARSSSGMAVVRCSTNSVIVAISSGWLSRSPAARHCCTAASQPARLERLNGRQQPGRVQPGHHVGPVRRPGPERARATASPAGSRVPAAQMSGPPPPRPGRLFPVTAVWGADHRSRWAIRTSSGLTRGPGRVGEQVVHPVADQHVLPQRHRAMLVHDDPSDPTAHAIPASPPNSSALLTVADRATSATDSGRWMMTSSHTAPARPGRAR